jgi:hypothetical protein
MSDRSAPDADVIGSMARKMIAVLDSALITSPPKVAPECTVDVFEAETARLILTGRNEQRRWVTAF